MSLASGVHLLFLAAAGLIWLVPPAEGVMLAAPLIPARPGETLAWATTYGARIVEEGPYQGSFLIAGDLNDLLAPAAANGILLFAAPSGGCGLTGPSSS